MLVDLKDGRCRTCGSQLEIIDVDDISLHVECIECADFYQVESDAFGDGCMTYWLGMMTENAEGGEDE